MGQFFLQSLLITYCVKAKKEELIETVYDKNGGT
jgi:hypothetical protein